MESQEGGRSLALDGDGANIAGSAFLNDGFRADGGVNSGREDRRQSPLREGELVSNYYRALNSKIQKSRVGFISATEISDGPCHAHRRACRDARGRYGSWGRVQPHGQAQPRGQVQPSGLDLDGFRYDRLAEKDDRGQAAAPTHAKIPSCGLRSRGRSIWQDGSDANWDQLVKVLHDNGYPEEAIEVAIEKNREKFKNNPELFRFMYASFMCSAIDRSGSWWRHWRSGSFVPWYSTMVLNSA